jgi:hypothetical protein
MNDHPSPTETDGNAAWFFWFNWEEISEKGNPRYGTYVFRKLLPHFSPKCVTVSWTIHSYFVYDGDMGLGDAFCFSCDGPPNVSVMSNVTRIGYDRCYLVAIYGTGPVDLSKVDQSLREAKVDGYIGMTSCSTVDFREFMKAMNRMMLVPACSISMMNLLEKEEEFGLINDEELRSMGFDPRKVE